MMRLARFSVLCVLAFGVIALDAFDATVTERLAVAMVNLLEWVLRGVGIEAFADANVLVVRGLSMRVSNECVAMPAYATLVSLEVAAGRRVMPTMAGVTLACGAFFALNVLRIFSLAVTWIVASGWFDTVHLFVWNMILFVVVTGYVWLRVRPWVLIGPNQRKAANAEHPGQ